MLQDVEDSFTCAGTYICLKRYHINAAGEPPRHHVTTPTEICLPMQQHMYYDTAKLHRNEQLFAAVP